MVRSLLLAALGAAAVNGHGFLSRPSSRNHVASLNGKEYCPHCKNGAGVNTVREHQVGGWPYPETPASSVRHGLCGEGSALGGFAQTYTGSAYSASGVVETYTPGQVATFEVTLTAHHMGWFEFSICDKDTLSDPIGPITQRCLDQHKLKRFSGDDSISPVDPAHPERFYTIPACFYDGEREKKMEMKYVIPRDLECEHCVLQWYWVTANSCAGPGYFDGIIDLFPATPAGKDCSGDGGSQGWVPGPVYNGAKRECLTRDGQPEEFWNCASISVTGKPGLRATTAPTSMTNGRATKSPTTSMATSSPEPPSTGNDGKCATAWVQCGGSTHKDGEPTCCIDGFVCESQNAYYSQCVPVATGPDGETPITSKPTPSGTETSGPTETTGPGTNLGTGYATRYWDCCKAHCAWAGNVPSQMDPMGQCTKDDKPIFPADPNRVSACDSPTATAAYTCHDNMPWSVSETLSYGFAAVPAVGDTCGKCFKLTFSGTGHYDSGNTPKIGAASLKGKQMIVQATNIGYDVGGKQFDVMIPGGGVGLFDACTAQWGVSDSSKLGAQYGGFLSRCQNEVGYDNHEALKECVMDTCDEIFGDSKFPRLHDGCKWFVDWFNVADNPNLSYEEVECPAALVAVSGMMRPGSSTPPPVGTTEEPAPTRSPTTEEPKVTVAPTTGEPEPTEAPTAEPTPEPTVTATEMPTASSTNLRTSSPSVSDENDNDEQDCAEEWQQCGGENWNGAKCCQGGLYCKMGNRWYSQCVKGAETRGPSQIETEPPLTTEGPDLACATAWGKCGGENWNGPTCCVSGHICNRKSKWYSQCIPN